MYRLMLYFLAALLGASAVFSAFGILPYQADGILLQTAMFVFLCWGLNLGFARMVGAVPNVESSLITGLILSAIIGPLKLPGEWQILAVAAVGAIASKYVFVFSRSHIFNPAAFGAVASAVVFGYPASWWIGSTSLMPIILAGGLLVLVKIKRAHLVLSFLGAYVGLLVLDALVFRQTAPGQIISLLNQLFVASPLLFFAFVMLVEPLTSPQRVGRRVAFGALVGIALFALQRFVTSIPFSLELALLAGNLAARVMNPDFRQTFILRVKEKLSQDIIGFWFDPPMDGARRVVFTPGQFLEYTLSHAAADSRGVRRYFTIASSPTEKGILLATRFSDPGSSFKRSLYALSVGSEITASKVAGEFILPANIQKKLVFIAGGIGITPFRSMTKYLLDTNRKCDIILLYGARTEPDFVFRDIFEDARAAFGMKNIYVPGLIDEALIRREVPDWPERLFYVSGPEPMVKAMEKILQNMGVPRNRIVRDYFPGYE